MNSFIICNVKIATPEKVIEDGFIYVKNGIIESIEITSDQKIHRSCNKIDGHGKWLIPGMIDVNSGLLEREIMPEPGLTIPVGIAFLSAENKLVSSGITTVYHSLTHRLFPDMDNVKALYKLKKYGSIRHNVMKTSFDELYKITNSSDIIKTNPIPDKNVKTDILSKFTTTVMYSNYIPSSTIYAIFALSRFYGVNVTDTVKMAAINPANALGIDKKLGSIECGKIADLVLIGNYENIPTVEKVFINGFKVYEKNSFPQNNFRHIKISS